MPSAVSPASGFACQYATSRRVARSDSSDGLMPCLQAFVRVPVQAAGQPRGRTQVLDFAEGRPGGPDALVRCKRPKARRRRSVRRTWTQLSGGVGKFVLPPARGRQARVRLLV